MTKLLLVATLLFVFEAQASKGKPTINFPSMKASSTLTTPITPIRYVAGKYALIKTVSTELPDGTFQTTETVVCQGTTSIPLSDTEPNGGEILADLVDCPTTTNGNVVVAKIFSVAMLSLKSHLFPAEGPIRIRDNVALLTLQNPQSSSSTGIPYGLNTTSSRDEYSTIINSVFPDSGGSCGMAPLPMCGQPSTETFRLNMEFGS